MPPVPSALSQTAEASCCPLGNDVYPCGMKSRRQQPRCCQAGTAARLQQPGSHGKGSSGTRVHPPLVVFLIAEDKTRGEKNPKEFLHRA